MSGNEVQGLKEDITEIKADVKEIFTIVNAMRISLAGDYATRQDLKEHEEKDRSGRRWWAGFIIGATGVVMTTINLMFGRSLK